MMEWRRFITIWAAPPILFGWELAVAPIPWTSLGSTILFALFGVVATHGSVYLRERKIASTRICALGLLVLSAALAGAMLYWKPFALLFFNGIVAVSYSLLATSNIRLGDLLSGLVACAAAVVAMNTSGAIRIVALVAACAVAVWLVRERRARTEHANDGESGEGPAR